METAVVSSVPVASCGDLSGAARFTAYPRKQAGTGGGKGTPRPDSRSRTTTPKIQLKKLEDTSARGVQAAMRQRAEEAGAAGQFEADMEALADWICRWGPSALPHVLDRLNDRSEADRAVRERMVQMVERYDIFLKGYAADGQDGEATCLTLEHVVSSIPHIIAQRIKQDGARVIGHAPEELDHFLCFPAGAALIPSTDTVLFDKWRNWSTSYESLNTKNIKQGMEKAKADATDIWNSNLFNDQERTNHLYSLREQEQPVN
eukprot:GHVT01066473.1.p1 GENE.GHVT01066473.1~~GHVT01066473.1.p1  ORF type:complete len:261 (-),score=49.99 GHVT01066473.1:727-1509(-)